MLVEISLILGLFLALAAEPDINNPFSPIYFDKESYSWTDKVKIMIVAPSWNSDKDAINSIGDDNENFIKISTRQHELKPYKLTETDVNSGIFVGEVILTGFLHDVDGDGSFDTIPKTSGTGPTNGFLETSRNDAITVSFAFTKNNVLTETALIKWNIANVEFLQDRYMLDQEAILRIVEPDMNLDPETIDQFLVDIISDSDPAGIQVEAIENSEDSGLFEAKIFFTQKKSSTGNILYANQGDYVTAQYSDRTLPQPYSKSDDLLLESTMILESNVPPLERTSLRDISISDNFGNAKSTLHVDEQLQIVGNVSNFQDFTQNFVFIFQIIDEQGAVVSLSWVQGELDSYQILDVSQSWIPQKSGTYRIETFVWESLSKPIPLALPQNESYFVRD